MSDLTDREHLEAVAREREARFDAIFDAHHHVHAQEEKTRDGMHAAIDSRLQELNRLRGEVIADRALFVTRDAFEAKADALDKRIDTLHDQIIEWKGREKGLSLTASFIVGGVGLIATILAIYFALAAV
jgi:hypothetical protein